MALLKINFGLLIITLGLVNAAKYTANEVKQISEADDDEHFQYALKNILVPRVVGTEGHEDVKNFIINDLKNMNFNVELDVFNQNVPIFGNLTFTNIIGRLNPDAEKYLVLACHYDSLYLGNQQFVGAVDSAVPCAIMLNTVKTLQYNLNSIRNQKDLSLMLIFFDGEEAFKKWSSTDKLYGSRHLANKWSKSNQNELKQIDVLILLDLIGASNAKFKSFYKNTEPLHHHLFVIERLLSRMGQLGETAFMFEPSNTNAQVDDDHRPFLAKGVPILHLIPERFPPQWHTTADNYHNLNQQDIANFMKILRIFTINYLT